MVPIENPPKLDCKPGEVYEIWVELDREPTPAQQSDLFRLVPHELGKLGVTTHGVAFRGCHMIVRFSASPIVFIFVFLAVLSLIALVGLILVTYWVYQIIMHIGWALGIALVLGSGALFAWAMRKYVFPLKPPTPPKA